MSCAFDRQRQSTTCIVVALKDKNREIVENNLIFSFFSFSFFASIDNDNRDIVANIFISLLLTI